MARNTGYCKSTAYRLNLRKDWVCPCWNIKACAITWATDQPERGYYESDSMAVKIGAGDNPAAAPCGVAGEVVCGISASLFCMVFLSARQCAISNGGAFVLDAAVARGGSTSNAYSEILSFENQKQMLIPRGFAHGYLTLEDDTLMQWCVDNDFCGEAARAVRYDSDFIWQTEPWPMREYILSEKDKNAIKLSELRKF